MTEFIRIKLDRPQKDMFDTDVVIVNKDFISCFVPSNGAIFITGLGYCYVVEGQRKEIAEFLGMTGFWWPESFQKEIPPDPEKVAEGVPLMEERKHDYDCQCNDCMGQGHHHQPGRVEKIVEEIERKAEAYRKSQE